MYIQGGLCYVIYICIHIYIYVNCGLTKKDLFIIKMVYINKILNFWRRNYFIILAHPVH